MGAGAIAVLAHIPPPRNRVNQRAPLQPTLQRPHRPCRPIPGPLVGRRSTKWICRLNYGAQCQPSKMCRRSCVMPCMLRWFWRSGPSSATASHAAVVSLEASRAWKLFVLAPRMLLARCDQQRRIGRAELLERVAAFQRGDWLRLLTRSRDRSQHGPRRDRDPHASMLRRHESACALVRRGEVSRARHVLTAGPLAPGDEATSQALTDPECRPPEPRMALPPAIPSHEPSAAPTLSARAIAIALRDARRGSAPGLSGMRAEHMKLLLQDDDGPELLANAATLQARAHVPQAFASAVALARMTALPEASEDRCACACARVGAGV